MSKYIFLLLLSFSVNASQTGQEIIDYCTHIMEVSGGGSNALILQCIKQETAARDEIRELSK